MYDRQCPTCGAQQRDCYEPIAAPDSACLACGQRTQRVFLGAANSVIADSIPGGLLIHHGLCWPDGTPRRFDSKTEIRKAEAESSWRSHVEHRPAHRGTDKSRHTSRWV